MSDQNHANIPENELEPHALEARITLVGKNILTSIGRVIESVPRGKPGPQALADQLGLDKVLASRVLKATRSRDPITATHRMPGPEPLRRLVRAAEAQGVGASIISDAHRAIDAFEHLIRQGAGDRSTLDAIVSAWVPEARREFELRRKQAAFKAMSQLKGVQSEAIVATVILWPGQDDARMDVVWLNGLVGVHRVRPNAPVKLSTRKLSGGPDARLPVSLDGVAVENAEGLLLPTFCSEPLPRMTATRAGNAVHYALCDDGFGPSTAADLFFAEVNRAELPRAVPAGSGRKRYFFAEASMPAKAMQFDVLIHESLDTSRPWLRLYDTAFEGVANVNDPARDADILDMVETIEPLGAGVSRFRSSDSPGYSELLRHACTRLGYDGALLRGYRCRVDFPVYGSQITMVFDPPVESPPRETP
ncbi:MAG: hypothetical protein KIT19_05235 [Phycisphaeraceae bacterium]|nr:hypothetical protein [Phycisphaeraceae bacterium]